jgi:3-methyl-2-oxobutanoate hydroxymethyltransferase
MSSAQAETRALTPRDFLLRKQRGERLVMVSAYDALFGSLAEQGGVDAILVGDSLGNAILGLPSTIAVTLDQMIHHATAVRRGATKTLVLIDMPFMTYQVSVEDALRNCARAMQASGVHGVKLEGAGDEVIAAVRALARCGIPVMGHVGFTPQSVHALGGFRVQGKEPDSAARLAEEAKRLEEAGAFAVVLELVPKDVATRVSESLTIPTIGIGAGIGCDGQVLVLPDLLGLNDRFRPKFLKRYAALADDVRGAVRAFAEDVRAGRYPDDEHSF